jgi:hypothetical protein
MGEPSQGRIDRELGTCPSRATFEANSPAGVKIMDYHIVEARYVADHVVWLRFRDGTSGEIDLTSVLRGPVFEPLRNPEVFSQFQLHPDFHTLVWPNGADLAPEYLRDQLRVTA